MSSSSAIAFLMLPLVALTMPFVALRVPASVPNQTIEKCLSDDKRDSEMRSCSRARSQRVTMLCHGRSLSSSTMLLFFPFFLGPVIGPLGRALGAILLSIESDMSST